MSKSVFENLMAKDGAVAFNGRVPQLGKYRVFFRSAEQIREELDDEYNCLDDYEGWETENPSYVPFASVGLTSEEFDALLAGSSLSFAEEFYCVDTSSPDYPVIRWRAEGGFVQVANSLTLFLDGLAPKGQPKA